MKHHLLSGRRSRARSLAAIVVAVGALSGCDALLDVENPQAIQGAQLSDRFYLNLLTNGVVSDFQRMFDDVAFFGGVFTDELRNHATFQEEPLIDQRDVSSGNGTAGNLVYAQLQRARGLADSTALRFRTLRGDSANADLRLARVLAYGGMTYVLMGETLCEIPVDLSAPFTPEQILRDFALPRFEEAIAVATAARAQAPALPNISTAERARIVAGADSIINLSRVGAARAALDLNDRARAIQFASQVPAAFLFVSYYSETATELNNFVWSRLTQTAAASVSGTPFEALRGQDPRVPIPTTTETAVGGLRVYIPNSPTAYSTYSGTLPGAEFSQGANIRIASGLEARYIVAEAEGVNAANIAFVNARRAIGGLTPLPSGTTSADYYMALRDQRRRDLYLDAHRLGDLRRYRTQYGDIEDINEFQQGSFYGSTIFSFADQYCFPVNSSELAGNPFYKNR